MGVNNVPSKLYKCAAMYGRQASTGSTAVHWAAIVAGIPRMEGRVSNQSTGGRLEGALLVTHEMKPHCDNMFGSSPPF